MSIHVRSSFSKWLAYLLFCAGERKHQTDNLRRTMTELEYCKEREERVKKELEVIPLLTLHAG